MSKRFKIRLPEKHNTFRDNVTRFFVAIPDIFVFVKNRPKYPPTRSTHHTTVHTRQVVELLNREFPLVGNEEENQQNVFFGGLRRGQLTCCGSLARPQGVASRLITVAVTSAVRATSPFCAGGECFSCGSAGHVVVLLVIVCRRVLNIEHGRVRGLVSEGKAPLPLLSSPPNPAPSMTIPIFLRSLHY